MKAVDIICAIMRPRYRRNFVLPHYTPRQWWECDVFELTAAKCFREFEVKISRADFFADRDKGNRTGTKYQLLAARSPRGPQFFWFVTPAGLVQPSEVPEWAGLIECTETRPTSFRTAIHPTVIIAAPKLHRGKIDELTEMHARGVCYWRLHNVMSLSVKASEKTDTASVEN